MYTHLKERQYYEDLYDRLTVEYARDHIGHYDKFHADLIKKLPKDDTIDRPGNALVLNAFYMQVIGAELLRRYENREQQINEWIARDESKDDQIAVARLHEEPLCSHCKKQGLRIIDKSLMHRRENSKHDDPEEVLFMLKCPHCDKNSAFWEDGKEWKYFTKCPKCNAKMNVEHRETKTAFHSTYTYTKCSHSYKEKMNFSTKKKNPIQILIKIVYITSW